MDEGTEQNSTPAEFYRSRRPEYFSDSKVIYDVEIPREVLAFELNKVSSYQKQDLFETLSRRLAEKFICPNLIPQVGPTGGGDGKTDTETYPVADVVAERWFIPENGWNREQKWAFAFSAKEEWKGKLSSDVKKVVETGRGYTRVYFISNQIISSKKKKDAQDELAERHGIEVIVLDAEWILEKVYSNDLVELVAETLNLSRAFGKKRVEPGPNDSSRAHELEKLETDIANPNRYSTGDPQLLDDAIRAAILSRMLERPRDETEGRFDRCERLCRQVHDNGLVAKLIYQRAWTYINYFGDSASFQTEFLRLRALISAHSESIVIEWYFNLFNILRTTVQAGDEALPSGTNLSEIEAQFKSILEARATNAEKPTSALLAKTYLALLTLSSRTRDPAGLEIALTSLLETVKKSSGYLDYPFETIKEILLEIGKFFSESEKFDELIDELASLAERRSSELVAGETFLKRGAQKLEAQRNREAVVYFGKSVYKLAKEETKHGLRLALLGLAEGYSKLELPWAAYTCQIAATWISFSDWYTTHVPTAQLTRSALDLANTELLLGRVPNFMVWYQLFSILSKFAPDNEETEVSPPHLLDACFSIRILSSFGSEPQIQYLPRLFEELGLVLSEGAALYLLGHVEEILPRYRSSGISTLEELDNLFHRGVDQPFQDQMLFDTQFQSGEELGIECSIVGCKVIILHASNAQSILASELVAGWIEGALGTAVGQIFPSIASICIRLTINTGVQLAEVRAIGSKPEILLELSHDYLKPDNRKALTETLVKLLALMLSRFFISKDIEGYLKNLFEKEELSERLVFVLEHPVFVENILGNDPKITFADWIDEAKVVPMIRERSLDLRRKTTKDRQELDPKRTILSDMTHGQFQVRSIISIALWEAAKWKGVVVFGDGRFIGLSLAFGEIVHGRQIFSNWKETIGETDSNELINISIIKGVNKKNPSWYRVVISGSLDKKNLEAGKLILGTSRIHEMNPSDSTNLDRFEREYLRTKRFIFCPSSINSDGRVELSPDLSIQKTHITIKNAWEIGLEDLDQVAIRGDDDPVLPSGVDSIPIIEVLKKKHNI